MSRLIDADALIETIENVCCKPCKEQKRDCNGVRCRSCQYGDEIDDIDSFHTAEQPHWIPCSERLPAEDGKYLCFYDYGEGTADYLVLLYLTESGEMFSKGWHNLHSPFDRLTDWQTDMVAYMPLPEPYKDGEE